MNAVGDRGESISPRRLRNSVCNSLRAGYNADCLRGDRFAIGQLDLSCSFNAFHHVV